MKKNVTLNWLHYSIATHIFEQWKDIRYIQTIPGHYYQKTTGIFTHLSNKSIRNIKSPIDRILEDKLNNNNELRKG